MSEISEYMRDCAIERMPKDSGWHVVRTSNDREILANESGSSLTFEEAYDIQFSEYNRGYDAAIAHIKSLIDREQDLA